MEYVIIEETGQKTDNIEKECMDLVCTLVNSTFRNGYDPDSMSHEMKLNDIIDIAVKKTFEMRKKINDARKVFPGDFVVVLVDDTLYKRYLLVRENRTYNWVTPTGTEVREEDFENLPVQTGLGYELVGRKIGNTFTYGEKDEKLYHTYKVLSVRKTGLSEDITKDELLADIEMRKNK